MKVIKTIFLTVALNMIYHQTVSAQNSSVPFTATSPSTFSQASKPSIISFSGVINNNKALLNWSVSQNQEAVQFEVERSLDGKKYKMVALVFGSDQADTANYQFFEKTKETKLSYRIKIIYKNGKGDYSSVIKAETFDRTIRE